MPEKTSAKMCSSNAQSFLWKSSGNRPHVWLAQKICRWNKNKLLQYCSHRPHCCCPFANNVENIASKQVCVCANIVPPKCLLPCRDPDTHMISVSLPPRVCNPNWSQSVHPCLYGSPTDTYIPGNIRDNWPHFYATHSTRPNNSNSILIWYNTRCYLNVHSKADIGQLNLPHGTKN